MGKLVPLYKQEFERDTFTEEQLRITILLTGEPTRIELIHEELKTEPLYRLIRKRLNVLFVPIADSSIPIYLAVILENPAQVSIMAHSLWHLYQEKRTALSLSDMHCAFGDGYPTADALSKFWDEQKISDKKTSKNAVDLPETYE